VKLLTDKRTTSGKTRPHLWRLRIKWANTHNDDDETAQNNSSDITLQLYFLKLQTDEVWFRFTCKLIRSLFKIIVCYWCNVGGIFVRMCPNFLMSPLLKSSALVVVFVWLLCTLMVWRSCQHCFGLNYTVCKWFICYRKKLSLY